MSLAIQPATAPSPFAALLDPSAALEAHGRLAVALAEGCVRWSPLDKPSIQPPREEAEAEQAAGAAELREEAGSVKLLWP